MVVICAFWVVFCSPVARQLAPESVPFRRFCGNSALKRKIYLYVSTRGGSDVALAPSGEGLAAFRPRKVLA